MTTETFSRLPRWVDRAALESFFRDDRTTTEALTLAGNLLCSNSAPSDLLVAVRSRLVTLMTREDPELMQGLLISFRTDTQVLDDELTELEQAFVAGQTPPLEAIYDVLLQRQSLEGLLRALDAPLLPLAGPAPDSASFARALKLLLGPQQLRRELSITLENVDQRAEPLVEALRTSVHATIEKPVPAELSDMISSTGNPWWLTVADPLLVVASRASRVDEATAAEKSPGLLDSARAALEAVTDTVTKAYDDLLGWCEALAATPNLAQGATGSVAELSIKLEHPTRGQLRAALTMPPCIDRLGDLVLWVQRDNLDWPDDMQGMADIIMPGGRVVSIALCIDEDRGDQLCLRGDAGTGQLSEEVGIPTDAVTLRFVPNPTE